MCRILINIKYLCHASGSSMRRVRHISTNPSEMGRACPIELIQHKPCPVIPCFSWHRSEWSKCDLHVSMMQYNTYSKLITYVSAFYILPFIYAGGYVRSRYGYSERYVSSGIIGDHRSTWPTTNRLRWGIMSGKYKTFTTFLQRTTFPRGISNVFFLFKTVVTNFKF
jgi:hypothetical protein